MLLLNAALCLPQISVIRKTDQVRRELDVIRPRLASYHDPEALNILPELAAEEKKTTADREDQVGKENDLIVIVLGGSQKVREESHFEFLETNLDGNAAALPKMGLAQKAKLWNSECQGVGFLSGSP